jgi:hypothetical protein
VLSSPSASRVKRGERGSREAEQWSADGSVQCVLLEVMNCVLEGLGVPFCIVESEHRISRNVVTLSHEPLESAMMVRLLVWHHRLSID